MDARRGQVLVMAYMVVGILTVLGGTFLGRGLTTAQHSEIQRLETELFHLVEGAIDDAITQFSTEIANFAVDPNIDTHTIVTTFAASPGLPNGLDITSTIQEAEPTQRTIVETDGTIVLVKNYRITATAQHPQNAAMTATINQVVARRLISTFQHAVFYQDDLEMLPGPNMTLSGRVHSNHDIYVGANNTLTIDTEYMRSAGNIYNRRKDSSVVPPGDISIRVAGTDPVEYELMDGLDSDSGTWETESQTRWAGTVRSAVHGVTELSVPSVGSIQPGEYYATQAATTVLNCQISEGATPLTEGTDLPPGTCQTTTSFYNNREEKWVQMTELDLHKLAGYDVGDLPGLPSYPNHLPSNGLLYASRDDVPAAYQGGVRLSQGAEIERQNGFTVVTNLPLYIQGDYNSVNKKATAVITDAVNVLSNDWDDSNTTEHVNNRVATDTTVNTAFMAGIDTTSTGNYNGGLENYPRMHETWTGITLTIRGSFVALWNSIIATGAWVYGNPQYKAPGRNWDYDTDFSSGTLPPFTPWAVEMPKGAWWK